MSDLVARPLGERIPKKLHAVSCSLPTMRDVIGYETKDPEVIAQICSGYPRFVVHDLTQELTERWSEHLGLGRDDRLWLTASRRAAADLVSWLAPCAARQIEENGLSGVVHADDPDLGERARKFLQHTGGFLSSRQAEDQLVQAGQLEQTIEETAPGDAASILRQTLARDFQLSDPETILLTNSGMNAFHAAFQAASDFQRQRDRTIWIQLGWLYLDTMAVIEKLGNGVAHRRVVMDVGDLDALRRVVRECGPRLAGLVTEAPSNPLIQTPDLATVSEFIRSAGGLMIVDPSVASAYNVDVVRSADLVVTSLTKYTAWEGDVIAGAALVTDSCPDRAQFLSALSARITPPYDRDAARLAFQASRAPDVVRTINEQTRAVAAFLAGHRSVKQVFWAESEAQGGHFGKIRRSGGGPGALLTIDLVGPLATFYDRLVLPKGPSFGITTSLVCPFLYLAHYDLVSSLTGRDYLKSIRLNPDLVRISVGTEPLDSVLRALDEALS